MYRFHTGGHGSPKIATAMTPKKTALQGQTQQSQQRWNQGVPHLRCRAKPHQSQAQARAPSKLGGKTNRTNLSVLHFNGGQPQARKMPCQKDGTRKQRTTSLDTGDTVSPMHHASNAKMKTGSYHVGNLPRNRCDWSG